MHRKATLGWLTGLLIAVALIAGGCSGGDGNGGDDGDVTPPPTDSGTLNGQVVAASDTRMVVEHADVTITRVGQTDTAQATRTATTGVDGGFVFDDLPAGTWAVNVTNPRSERLGTGSARVSIVPDRTSTISVAVLPLGLATPERILLDPTSATIDVNGRIAYRAEVIGPGGEVYEDIEPTWVVEGGVGRISPEGVFTAQSVGSGGVRAYSGSAERRSSLTVVGPRPPEISSFRVNPQSLPATGGEILISAAISDGDGSIPQDVTAEILPAGGEQNVGPLDVSNDESDIGCPSVQNCHGGANCGVT